MDDFERQCLYNCRHDFYSKVDIKSFISKLSENGMLTDSRRADIERCSSDREQMIKLLQYLSFKNEDCFGIVIQLVKDDYSDLARKIELELLKERARLSKDINDGLIEVINEQLFPIVYGKGQSNRQPDEQLTSERPSESLERLSVLITQLKLKCLRILGMKPSDLRRTSLPALINKRIKEQQETIRQLKSDIKEIEDLPKKNKLLEGKEEVTPSEKVYYLRRNLQEQHENVRQKKLTLKSKEQTALRLKQENARMQKAIQELKKERKYSKMDVDYLFDEDS